MKGWRRVFVGMSVLSLLSPGTGFADGPATSSAYVPEPYDTANVAQGKTASMIGGTPAAGRGPEGGIDYDFTTFVQSDQNVAWDYKLDLGASHSVKEVKFTSDSVHYATSYSVKVSTDGANYAEVAADVVDEGGVTKRYTFPATDARYILIDVATTAGDAGHIVREVEVYDETAAPNVAYVFSYHKDEPGPPSNLHYNYAIESLQGLVNRDGPKLFLKRSNYWADGYWNEDWIERYATDYGIAFQEFACPTPDPATGDCLVADYEAVLKKFRDKLSGIAIYDTQVDGSAQVALTLAGTDGVLPVPDYLYTDWLPALAGLPILYDFRGDFANSVEAYRWALEEGGVMQKTDRMHAHTPAGPNVDGKFVGGGPYRAIDWNVMHKGFQFNLTFNYVETDSFGGTRIAGDKAQADMYRRILGELEPGALIVGYGEFENDWFDLLSDYNVDYLHWGDNMSFHNKVPALGALKQKRHVREDDIQLQDYQEKYLVAFVTSEGDTLKGPLTSYFDTWKSEGRGAVPYNWMLSPLMVHFPAMTEYYYRNATDLDYFGAFDILRFPHSHLADVGAKMRADMEAIDLTSLSGYSSFSLPAEWKALADMTNAQGFADIDWGTIRGPGLSVTPNGRPYIVQDNMVSYWQAQVYGWGTKWNDKPRAVLAQDLANQIRAAARKHPAPYPIVVYGDIHEYPELLTMYRDVMNLLDPAAFKAVRLDEAFAVMEKKRMKSNLAYGKTATMLGGSPGWGHVPSKALDGELGSYVQSDQDVLWDLRIDLGGVQEITTVEFTPDRFNYATSYEILTSTDDVTYTEQAEETNGTGTSKTYTFAPTAARYVKIHVKARNNWNHAIHEVEVYNNPVNLARVQGASATMLGGVPGWGNVADFAVDGTSKYAQAYRSGPQQSDPLWDLRIDLGSVKDVNTVVFTPDEHNFATHYRIMTSTDDVNYQVRTDFASGTSGPYTHRFDTVQARYVKIDVLGRDAPNDVNDVQAPHAIREAEVYRMPDNLARGKAAFMLDGTPGWGHVASRMTDGDAGTYAQSDQDVLWDAKIDLGSVQSFNTVLLDTDPINYATQYEILTSSDDVTYTVRAVGAGGAGYAVEHAFETVQARFVKVNVISRKNANHAIREIEVYRR